MPQAYITGRSSSYKPATIINLHETMSRSATARCPPEVHTDKPSKHPSYHNFLQKVKIIHIYKKKKLPDWSTNSTQCLALANTVAVAWVTPPEAVFRADKFELPLSAFTRLATTS